MALRTWRSTVRRDFEILTAAAFMSLEVNWSGRMESRVARAAELYVSDTLTSSVMPSLRTLKM